VDDSPLWGILTAVSTRQAEGHSFGLAPEPVAYIPNDQKKRRDVMNEVMLPDGKPPFDQWPRDHSGRSGAWFGFLTGIFPLPGWTPARLPGHGYLHPKFLYTGVGYENVGDIAREIVDSTLISVSTPQSTTKASTPNGQGPVESRSSAKAPRSRRRNVGRPLPLGIALRKVQFDINYHCKPLGATDWNFGHALELSTTYMREVGGRSTLRS